MRVCFTPLAATDLEKIADYIAQDNPSRAISFVQEIKLQCQKIASAPNVYRLRSEIARDLRSCAFGRYVIFFQIEPAHVLIVRILHSAMDLPQQFEDMGSH
jgi:toxin ParE1/3/4